MSRRLRRNLERVASGAVLLALGVAAGLGFRFLERWDDRTTLTSAQSERIDNWREYVRGGQVLGPRDAALSLVVFSDYQCPYCKAMLPTLQRLRAAHPSLAVVVRQYPIPGHAFARDAALASECAARAGRFEEFQDTAFAVQDSLGSIPWERLAARAGIPSEFPFVSSMAGDSAAAAIALDVRDGDELGIPGTPTMLLGDRKLVGGRSFEQLDRLVRAILTR